MADRVKDDATTRIKAADARSFWNQDPSNLVLMAFTDERAFQALAVMHFNLDGTYRVRASGAQSGDGKVLRDWCVGFLRENGVPSKRGCVLFGIHKDGIAEVATYGVTSKECDAMGAWGLDFLKSITTVPFQTWFGLGKDGVPTPLTAEQREKLSPQGQDYADLHTKMEPEA